MESYKKIELNNNQYEFKYDYNLGISNFNSNIQIEYDKKIDILLDGMLSNNINNKK